MQGGQSLNAAPKLCKLPDPQIVQMTAGAADCVLLEGSASQNGSPPAHPSCKSAAVDSPAVPACLAGSNVLASYAVAPTPKPRR